MPDLSAYLDFAVTLNYRTGKLVVQDTSVYPAGVANDIKGIVSTTQPDKINVVGDWGSPNVFYENGSLKAGQTELRNQTNGDPQQGLYTVEYEVDHPGYTPTKKIKTFTLSYLPNKIEVGEEFDLFTPELVLRDNTNYIIPGFTNSSLSRAWSITSTPGNLGGSDVTIDLAISTNYHDSIYNVQLKTLLTYQHNVYAFLKVTDETTFNGTFSAQKPPTFTTLQGYLKTIKERFDNLQSCSQTTTARQDYEYAASLLQHIKNRICANDLIGLHNQIQDFLNVYYQHVSSPYVYTNTAIPSYSYADVNCGTGSGTIPPPLNTITISDINKWNEAYAMIAPGDLEYVVGVDVDAPVEGTNTFSHALLANKRARLLVNKIPVSTKDWQGNFYYSKIKADNFLTLTGYTWQAGDLVQIEIY